MANNETGDGRQFLVRRDDLRKVEVRTRETPALDTLEPGSVLLAVDRFAFTSNNITYAVYGEEMSYFEFFPAPEGWARVPVWGFADVAASRHDALPESERVFGFLPMATHLTVAPAKVTAGGFFDSSEHRRPLHAAYNRYMRAAGDPGYDPAREDQQMLYRPLFMTSFLIDDFLADNGFFGAKRVILSSASSKTAYGVAFLLDRRDGETVEVVGLTSPGNVEFVQRLGCYDTVLPYPEAETLAADVPTLYVDMAGDGELRRRLHEHLEDELRYDCVVGGTHWEARGPGRGLPGAKPEFFFAPAQAAKREQDWGPEGMQRRFAAAWRAFLEAADDWAEIVRETGPEAVRRVWLQMLEGEVDPKRAHILSL